MTNRDHGERDRRRRANSHRGRKPRTRYAVGKNGRGMMAEDRIVKSHAIGHASNHSRLDHRPKHEEAVVLQLNRKTFDFSRHLI